MPLDAVEAAGLRGPKKGRRQAARSDENASCDLKATGQTPPASSSGHHDAARSRLTSAAAKTAQ
jgi:hypothetical protein